VRTVQVYLVRGNWLEQRFRVARKIGTYGKVQVRAVKAFQLHVKLTRDGVVGRDTFEALHSRYGRPPR
jgi:murein L,D-transpeptidase YcbB/YkuD